MRAKVLSLCGLGMLVLTGCSGDATAPEDSIRGVWVAVSADGQPLPAERTTASGRMRFVNSDFLLVAKDDDEGTGTYRDSTLYIAADGRVTNLSSIAYTTYSVTPNPDGSRRVTILGDFPDVVTVELTLSGADVMRTTGSPVIEYRRQH